VVSPLISRALTRPLSELQSAAEDIARGNYSRRVALTGKDEMGVVGQAFNRMAEAVEGPGRSSVISSPTSPTS